MAMDLISGTTRCLKTVCTSMSSVLLAAKMGTFL